MYVMHSLPRYSCVNTSTRITFVRYRIYTMAKMRSLNSAQNKACINNTLMPAHNLVICLALSARKFHLERNALRREGGGGRLPALQLAQRVIRPGVAGSAGGGGQGGLGRPSTDHRLESLVGVGGDGRSPSQPSAPGGARGKLGHRWSAFARAE